MKTRQVTAICLLVMLALHVVAIGNAVAQSPATVTYANPPTKADPVMTEELLARMSKFTRDREGTSTLGVRICKVLGLGDGTQDMKLKLTKSNSAGGNHYFGLPLDTTSKDILIIKMRGESFDVYLTDNTGKLRAAIVDEDGKTRLITNEAAAEKFNIELSVFLKNAAHLPPTEAATGKK